MALAADGLARPAPMALLLVVARFPVALHGDEHVREQRWRLRILVAVAQIPNWWLVRMPGMLGQAAGEPCADPSGKSPSEQVAAAAGPAAEEPRADPLGKIPAERAQAAAAAEGRPGPDPSEQTLVAVAEPPLEMPGSEYEW